MDIRGHRGAGAIGIRHRVGEALGRALPVGQRLVGARSIHRDRAVCQHRDLQPRANRHGLPDIGRHPVHRRDREGVPARVAVDAVAVVQEQVGRRGAVLGNGQGVPPRHRRRVLDGHLVAVGFLRIRLAGIVVHGHRDGVAAFGRVGMGRQGGRLRGRAVARHRRAVAPVDRIAVEVAVGIGEHDARPHRGSFGHRRVVERRHPRRIVDRGQVDGRRGLAGIADPVGREEQEGVLAVEIRLRRVDQQPGIELAAGDHLIGRDGSPAQRQRAEARQRGDADLGQRLSVGIVEARVEGVEPQHLGLVLGPGEGRARHRGGIAVDLVEHAPAAAVAGIAVADLGGPGNGEAAIGKRRDRGLHLVAAGLGIHQEIAVQPRARGVVLLGEDAGIVVAAAGLGIGMLVAPGDDESAGIQRRGEGMVLRVGQLVVDAELRPCRRAVRPVELGIDAGAAAVLCLRLPGDDEAAALQPGDRRAVLGRGGFRVRPERGRTRRRIAGLVEQRAVARHALEVHVAAVDVGRGEGHDEFAGGREIPVPERRGAPAALVVRHRSADAELAAILGAVRVVELRLDRVAAAVADVGIGVPDDCEAAAAERDDLRRVLVAGIDRVDLHRRAADGLHHFRLGLQARIDGHHLEAAQEHVVLRPAGGARAVLPDHAEAHAAERGEARIDLVGRGLALGHVELAADPLALGREALAVDPPARAVLGVGMPGHDEGAVLQHCHFRLVLAVRREGVGLPFAQDRRRAVGRRVHRHLDQHRIGHAAVPVGQRDPHRAGADRIVGDVAVGQRLDHLLHRLGIRHRVEADLQRLAAGAGTLDLADDRAADGDVAARDRDPAAGRQPELVLRAVVGRIDLELVGRDQVDRDHGQQPAAEIGAVGVGDRRRAVDVQQLRRGVHKRLVEGQRGGQALQQRIVLARGAAADHPGIDVVIRAVHVGGEGGHIGIAVQRGQRHVELGRRGAVMQPLRAVGPRSVRRVMLRPDVPAVAARTGAPGDDEAAVTERGHVRVELLARRVVVDPEGIALGRARGAEDARIDAFVRPVLALRNPGGDQAPVSQRGDRGIVLRAGRDLVDLRRTRAQLGAGAVEALQEDAPGPVGRVGGLRPGRSLRLVDQREAAARGGADVRKPVRRGAGGFARQHPLGTAEAAVGLDLLAVDAGAAGHRVDAAPDHDETAVLETRDLRLVLRARGGAVDPRLAAGCAAVGAVELNEDPVARTVEPVQVGPDHGEAAARQACHLRFVLAAGNRGVDLELGAQRHPVGAVALAEDAMGILARIVLLEGAPDHDIAGGRIALRHAQGRDIRQALIVRREAVGQHLRIGERREVVPGRHRHGQVDRGHHPAGAVADRQAEHAAGQRIVAGIGVAERLDQRLHARSGGIAVQRDRKRPTRLSVLAGRNGADLQPAEQHRIARDRDLSARHDAQHVLALVVRRGIGIDMGIAGQPLQPQLAAREDRGVGIRQRDRRSQQHQPGIDLRFPEGDVRHAGQHRRHGQRGSTARHEIAGIDAVIAAVLAAR